MMVGECVDTKIVRLLSRASVFKKSTSSICAEGVQSYLCLVNEDKSIVLDVPQFIEESQDRQLPRAKYLLGEKSPGRIFNEEIILIPAFPVLVL